MTDTRGHCLDELTIQSLEEGEYISIFVLEYSSETASFV